MKARPSKSNFTLMVEIASRFVYMHSEAMQVDPLDDLGGEHPVCRWLARRAQVWERMDGYLLARDMERDLKHFEPSAEAVAVLDGFWAQVLCGIQDATRAWVMECQISPTLKPGATVEVEIAGEQYTGRIIGIEHGEGRYRVNFEGDLVPKLTTEEHCDLYVPYESVSKVAIEAIAA